MPGFLGSTPSHSASEAALLSTCYVCVDEPEGEGPETRSVPRTLEDRCVVARRNGPADAKVSVYRFDPVDEKPWNADHYSVWLDLRSHVDFPSLVNRLSTSDDVNMVEYLLERVHRQKDARDPNLTSRIAVPMNA